METQLVLTVIITRSVAETQATITRSATECGPLFTANEGHHWDWDGGFCVRPAATLS